MTSSSIHSCTYLTQLLSGLLVCHLKYPNILILQADPLQPRSLAHHLVLYSLGFQSLPKGESPSDYWFFKILILIIKAGVGLCGKSSGSPPQSSFSGSSSFPKHLQTLFSSTAPAVYVKSTPTPISSHHPRSNRDISTLAPSHSMPSSNPSKSCSSTRPCSSLMSTQRSFTGFTIVSLRPFRWFMGRCMVSIWE